MNTNRILKLADLIEAGDDKLGFNMETYGSASGAYEDRSGHNCGTVACIGGWAVAAFGAYGKGEDVSLSRVIHTYDVPESARNLLGLEADTAARLFLAGGISSSDVTPAVAARCLRNLAETGEVDWEKAMEAASDQAS